MARFQGLDFYSIDQSLSPDERQVRDLVRDWVTNEVLPGIEQHAREGTFPLHLIPKMGEELGLFGSNFNDYGCAGLSAIAYGLIMQELERGDSGLRSFASVQGSLVMYPIREFGSEAQKERWLPLLRRGAAIGCFGLTEPDHGSDPGGMETRAVRTDRGWLLSGTKMWITNGSIADVAVVWARTEDGIRGFLVERGTPGFTTSDVKRKFSLRASVTSELSFQDCEVPADSILSKTTGLKNPLMCLNQARYGIAWGAIGAAQACYDAALRYTLARTQFGKPLAAFQLVQNKLCQMVTEITKAQLLALQLGRLKDQGQAKPALVSLAKRNNVAIALDIARTARDMLGANGITDEYPVGRHMVNLESVSTYEGTHDIHALIVGHAVTGIEAFA
ncbi:MAG: acyl-CoA dehydrogenase family protein [Candidatus Eisenbacteria bacterium]|nr:acyl-CoA dehydrogenase family protein [Candidatus Eisenbacteria bacterium]